MCVVGVTISYECKPTLAIHGGCRDTDSSKAPDIISGFYRPMNFHHVTLISAIRTVYLFFCTFVFYIFYALYGSAT